MLVLKVPFNLTSNKFKAYDVSYVYPLITWWTIYEGDKSFHFDIFIYSVAIIILILITCVYILD